MQKIQFFKNRFVLSELVRKRVKAQYRNSFLGMLWTVLNPLLNMLVMYVIFKEFFGRSDKFYAIYLLCGNILFSALRSGTEGGLTSIVNNRGLLTRTKIDSYLFPLSASFTSLINFFFSFIALLAIMLVTQLAVPGANLFSFRIFTVILMIPAFVLFEYGIGLFLSAIYVFCRDVKYLYTVFLTLWTYLTPVFYKVDTLPSDSIAMKAVKLNPMYYFVRFFRDAMYMGWSEYPVQDLLVLYLFGIVSVVIGYAMYKLLKKHFMMYI